MMDPLPEIHLRKVRSFVRRPGRVTAAQRRALEQLLPRYGVATAVCPLDLDALFGRRAARVFDIGFGDGEALVTCAANYPQIDYLGVEVHEPGIGHLLLLLEKAGLTNVRVIMRDAADVVREQVGDASFDAVNLFFPDPWPKKRHHKRRLVQGPFVPMLVERLESGGVLRIATDWQPYALEMLATLSGIAQLRNLALDGAFVPRPPEREPTRFEQRGARLGHQVWDLAFRRT